MLGVISKWLVRVNMVKWLMIMHHIILCTPCIALYVIVSYLNFCVRPRGARTRGTTGASTHRRTLTSSRTKASPGASNHTH
jgi:hypothetical protein